LVKLWNMWTNKAFSWAIKPKLIFEFDHVTSSIDFFLKIGLEPITNKKYLVMMHGVSSQRDEWATFTIYIYIYKYIFIYLIFGQYIYAFWFFLVGGNKTTFTQKQVFFFFPPWFAWSGNHPSKGLARFGYILDMKVLKNPEFFYIFGYLPELIIKNLAIWN
jgi:hypothetical protein